MAPRRVKLGEGVRALHEWHVELEYFTRALPRLKRFQDIAYCLVLYNNTESQYSRHFQQPLRISSGCGKERRILIGPWCVSVVGAGKRGVY